MTADGGSSVLRALTEGVGGAQGGVVAGIAVIPLEIVVFRQGADPTGKSTLLGVAGDIYQQSGADPMNFYLLQSPAIL